MASVRQQRRDRRRTRSRRATIAAVDAYEPGSVAKVITVAAALNDGPSHPRPFYLVPWRKQYYDDLLTDSHQHPDEWLSVSQILTESSNIGTIWCRRTMRSLSASATTCVRSGSARRRRSTSPASRPASSSRPRSGRAPSECTVAYGQGVASTSIQLVGARSTRSPTSGVVRRAEARARRPSTPTGRSPTPRRRRNARVVRPEQAAARRPR